MKILKLRIVDPVKAFDTEKKFKQLEDLFERLPIYIGNGTPEGQINAPVGSVFFRLDGGTGTTFYVKEAGVEATGWIGK